MAITVVTDFNPIKITGTTDASTLVYEPSEAMVKVKSVYWYLVTTSGHLLHLTDKNGNDIVKMQAEGNATSQQVTINVPYDSIYCADMDSGTVYIYH